MDVSKLKSADLSASGLGGSEMGGAQLLETLVTLTGLPKPMVYQELDQVLDLSQDSTQSLTLDQLRQAMLSYLEAFAPENLDLSSEADQPSRAAEDLPS
jgi:hypothetical protein